MLAPLLNDAITRQTDGANSCVNLSRLATAASRLVVVPIPDEPDWLPPVETEFLQLQALATEWVAITPTMMSVLLVAAIDYAPLPIATAATAKQAGGNLSTAVWLPLLEAMVKNLQLNVTNLTATNASVEAWLAKFGAIMPQIDTSIQAGWNALASEEQEMVQLATALGALAAKVQALGVQLDSDIVGGGKSYVSSIVSTLYSMVSAGVEASIPILGTITTLLTLGQTFYQIFKDNADLIDDMNQINALQAEMSSEAVQVALTKSTLQTLYMMEALYLGTRDGLPALIDMWQDELDKAAAAIDALQAGADPAHYLDLVNFQAAAANWQGILTYTNQLQAAVTGPVAPATIDIANATITQG